MRSKRTTLRPAIPTSLKRSIAARALLAAAVIEINTEVGLNRWLDAQRDIASGNYPPIDVIEGNKGIPLIAVQIGPKMRRGR